jgi:hypothetical protein
MIIKDYGLGGCHLCYNWEQIKQCQANYQRRTDKCCTKESNKSCSFHWKTAQQSFIFQGLTENLGTSPVLLGRLFFVKQGIYERSKFVLPVWDSF